jgi:hypothetical protein
VKQPVGQEILTWNSLFGQETFTITLLQQKSPIINREKSFDAYKKSISVNRNFDADIFSDRYGSICKDGRGKLVPAHTA